jgi:hypothetical protein
MGMWAKGIGGWIWCNYCTHTHTIIYGKMIHVETILGMGEGGIKENEIHGKNVCKCYNV